MSDNFAEINTQNPAFLALTGSLLFADMPRFDLSFTDRRAGQAGYLARSLAPVLPAYGFPREASECLAKTGAAGGVLETSLTLSVPASLAGAWLRTPGERDPNFFEVYTRVSIAVQQAMRRWLPYIYFSDPCRYEDIRVAYPLVFYRSTWPCSGRRRNELAYDLVSPECPGVAREWAARPFAAELGRVRQLLIAAGRRDLVRYYDPEEALKILRSIVQQPRHINALLTGDAFFIDQLVNLGLKIRRISEEMVADPSKATRDIVGCTADFAALSNRRLRRLYGGQDFTALGDLLLIEATRALAAALDGDAVISATLRVSIGTCQQTFVNDGHER